MLLKQQHWIGIPTCSKEGVISTATPARHVQLSIARWVAAGRALPHGAQSRPAGQWAGTLPPPPSCQSPPTRSARRGAQVQLLSQNEERVPTHVRPMPTRPLHACEAVARAAAALSCAPRNTTCDEATSEQLKHCSRGIRHYVLPVNAASAPGGRTQRVGRAGRPGAGLLAPARQHEAALQKCQGKLHKRPRCTSIVSSKFGFLFDGPSREAALLFRQRQGPHRHGVRFKSRNEESTSCVRQMPHIDRYCSFAHQRGGGADSVQRHSLLARIGLVAQPQPRSHKRLVRCRASGQA